MAIKGYLRQLYRDYVPRETRQNIKNVFKIGGASPLSGSLGYDTPTFSYYDPFSNPSATDTTSNQTTDTAEDTGDVYTPAGGGGGGGGTTYEPDWTVTPWDMTRYDLNNPSDLARYIQSTDAYYTDALSKYERNAADLRDIDIEQAVADEQRAQRNIDNALVSLSEKKDQYNEDYVQSLADLAEGFRQGSARRQAFYAAAAPRVYQSSQGTSQKYAEGKFQEGQKRYGTERTRAMNEFSRAESGYRENKQDLSNQLNLYRRNRQTEFEGDVAAKRESIAGQRAGLAQVDSTARSTSNKFSAMPTYSPGTLDYSPSQVNLNDLMQFIKFQPTTNAYATSSVATPKSGGESLTNYMGYQEPEEEESTINAYKKGYGLY